MRRGRSASSGPGAASASPVDVDLQIGLLGQEHEGGERVHLGPAVLVLVALGSGEAAAKLEPHQVAEEVPA